MPFDIQAFLQQFLPGLLEQQMDLTGGMGQQNLGPSALEGLASGPIALNPEFNATLSQMLQTGAPVDVSGAVAGERAATERAMRDMTSAFNVGMGAKGKIGSTAHTSRQVRGTEDLLSKMFERISGLEVGSREAAAGRRSGALSTALGQGQLDLGARGLDLERAGGLDRFATEGGRLGLAGEQAQAGAGMNLLGLLTSFLGRGTPPDRTPSRAASRPRPANLGSQPTVRRPKAPQKLGGVGTTSQGGRDQGARSMGNALLLDRLGRAHRMANQTPRFGGPSLLSDEDYALTRPHIMAQYGGMTGQPDMAKLMLGIMSGQADTAGALGGSSAANTQAIMPLLLQMLMGQQASALGHQFGPAAASAIGG
jgi:hypothetical protein